MSAWTKVRNEVEALVEPELAEAANLAHTILENSEAAATGNIQLAFSAATAAFVGVTGSLEAKAIAAGSAFVTALIGYEVTIVKAAKATVTIPGTAQIATTETTPVVPAAPSVPTV